jgi:4-diphosphocytidyl-2-C-methyl-D-erythritol kinase
VRPLVALAPAKVNLCLFVGPVRADGRHELATVFDTLDLADTVHLELAEGPRDEVVCPGVDGPNLAAAALIAFRARTGWGAPPVCLTIDKRIPLAGGMAGGSADAAAALRLAAAAAGVDDPALLEELAAQLGADVPAQVRGGRVLAGGAGEDLRPLPAAGQPYGVLVLPVDARLGAGEVYATADRLGLTRDAQGLATAREAVEEALPAGLFAAGLVANDLEVPARALCPAIDDALEVARAAGADHALVSGSGPTALGLFLGADGPRRAHEAAAGLADRRPRPLAAAPLPAGAGAPRPAGEDP